MARRSDLQEVVQQFVDKLSSIIESEVVSRAREAIQLCPVPGCSNRAAPVFGMVCAKHKDLPKAAIKKYREARRAKKLKKQAK